MEENKQNMVDAVEENNPTAEDTEPKTESTESVADTT